ncbi:ribonuclease VapC [archaeon]|nr:ribonuclease VapC [archaeon]
MTKKIYLDTNFLVYCVQNKISILDELNRICDFKYEICIIDKTIEELRKLKGKYSQPGKIAELIVNKLNIQKIKSDKTVDEALIELSDEEKIVATNDKELIKKLNCKVIIVKQKKYLAFR